MMNYLKQFWRWILTVVFGLGIASAAVLTQNEPLPVSVVDCIADTAKKISERIETCPVPKDKRGTLKGQEIAKIGAMAKTRRTDGFDGYIEIIDIKERADGVEVFARAWDKNNNQIGFGDGTVDIERFVIVNPPILVDDPNGTIVRESVDPDTGVTKTRKLREDLREAVLQSLAHTILVKQQKFGSENIIAGQVGNTTLTAYPNAGTGTAPIDGRFQRSGIDETFATVRAGAGTGGDATETETTPVGITSSATTDQFSALRRGTFGFNTSTIGTGTVDSAIFSAKGTEAANISLGDVNMDIELHTPVSESAIEAADYNVAKFGGTRWATGIALSALTTGYNNWTLNASGKAGIDKTGNTIIGTRLAWDFDNSFGGTWQASISSQIIMIFADTAGTTSDPKLVVEHTAAPAAAEVRRALPTDLFN